MNTSTDHNYYDMADDEVMGMTGPAAPADKTPEKLAADQAAAEQAEADRLAAEEAARVQAEADAAAAAAANAGGEGSEDGAGGESGQPDPLAAADDASSTPAAAKPAEAKDPAAAQPPAGDPAADPAKAVGDKSTPDPAGAKTGDQPAAELPKDPTPEDHKAFYDRILGQPIKANGKDIQLRSPEEAERLIQMGLNYTKKMQAWQPRMRVVTMLENNGLLDEAKLSHLIDLSKGDPLAIQKLLADSKFDPMSVDADQAASYKPGNHQVSDTEMAFNAALDDLESTDTGAELITEVAKQWDERSRQAVYQDPSILRVINEQKGLGLYARITTEMDRLKALGHLQGVPFLQAYRAVGDMLNDQGLLKPAEPQKQPDPTPVETRVATPAPKVSNNEKAAAASPTKATPAAAKTEQNFLDLPDDQFLKQMQGRL